MLKSYISFDVETTGLNPLENEIIEIGALKVRDGKVAERFMEFIKHSLDDLPATCQLIEELAGRGYRLFCLSNMSEEYYDYLKDRRVFSFFEGQVISALEGLIKPDIAIFRLISERYHLAPAETLFIDDLERNIRAAGEWGFQTVHFADREKGIADIRQLLA